MAKDYEEENGSATITLNGTLRHCSNANNNSGQANVYRRDFP
jgi:hypothetical protein